VVWGQSVGTSSFDNRIFFKRSTDGGASFEMTLILGGLDSRFPDVAASGNNVWCSKISSQGESLTSKSHICTVQEVEQEVVLAALLI